MTKNTLKRGWIVRLMRTMKPQGGGKPRKIVRWVRRPSGRVPAISAIRDRSHVFDTLAEASLFTSTVPRFGGWTMTVEASDPAAKNSPSALPSPAEIDPISATASTLLRNLGKPHVQQAIGTVLVEVLAPLALLILSASKDVAPGKPLPATPSGSSAFWDRIGSGGVHKHADLPTQAIADVLIVVKYHDGPTPIEHIVRALGVDRATIDVRLTRAVSDGWLKRSATGFYVLGSKVPEQQSGLALLTSNAILAGTRVVCTCISGNPHLYMTRVNNDASCRQCGKREALCLSNDSGPMRVGGVCVLRAGHALESHVDVHGRTWT